MYTPIYPMTQPRSGTFQSALKAPSPHPCNRSGGGSLCVRLSWVLLGTTLCRSEGSKTEEREELGLPCDAEMPEAPAQPTPHRALQSCPTLKQESLPFASHLYQSLDKLHLGSSLWPKAIPGEGLSCESRQATLLAVVRISPQTLKEDLGRTP